LHSISNRLLRQSWIELQELPIKQGAMGLVSLPSHRDRGPIATGQDGSVAIIHGYLTNKRELCLRWNLSQDLSDSSLILDGFRLHGPKVIEQFDGSYNISIFDASSDSLYLVNDCYGHLPIYYHSAPSGRVIFGPELKVFADCPWFERTVDWEGVADYLVLGQPWGDRTMLGGVKCLEPGTFVRWSGGQQEVRRYWKIPYLRRSGSDISSMKLGEELNHELERSMGLLSVLPGSKALFISGGFDSRTIACYMKRMLKEPFDSLGMHFGSAPATDSIVSTRIAEALGIPWKAISYEIKDAAKLFREHLEIHDGTWPCSYLAQALPVTDLRREYTHIINGNNGNHLFGDYATRFFSEMAAILKGGVNYDFFAAAGGDGLLRALTFRLMSGSMNYISPLLEPAFAEQATVSAVRSFDKEYFCRSDICGADKYEYLAVTQTGRRYGLFNPPLQDYYEGLNPLYHNRELMSFTTSLPFEWKFSRTLNSEGLARHFPKVAALPKISGYPSFLRYPEEVRTIGSSVDDYYSGQFVTRQLLRDEFEQIFTDPSLSRHTWLNKLQVAQYWEQHKAGTADHTASLTTLVSLDYFIRSFVGV
jgi:hypothetical protein